MPAKKMKEINKKDKEKKIEECTVNELIKVCEKWDDCTYGCLLYNLDIITREGYCPVQMLASIYDKKIKVSN